MRHDILHCKVFNGTVVNVTNQTTQLAALIDFQLLSTGLQSSNRTQMTTLPDTEFDDLESIFRNSVHSLETLDLTANCQLTKIIDSHAFADSLSNCLIVECFQNLLMANPSILGVINSVYENNSTVANTLFNKFIQLMEEDGLISSDSRLKFGLDLTTDQCRSSQLSVEVPDQISQIKGAIIGQGTDLSGLPESTVLEEPFFVGFDLQELTIGVNNPVFVNVLNGDDFDTSLVSGTVTTTEDNPAKRPYCYNRGIQCYQSQVVSGNYLVGSINDFIVVGCMDSTACNYDQFANSSGRNNVFTEIVKVFVIFVKRMSMC